MLFIANKWGKGELWEDRFDYVYKLTLKQLLRERCIKFINQYKHKKLEAFIAYNLANGYEKKAAELFDKIEINNKNRTLLLIDGYDEI